MSLCLGSTFDHFIRFVAAGDQIVVKFGCRRIDKGREKRGGDHAIPSLSTSPAETSASSTPPIRPPCSVKGEVNRARRRQNHGCGNPHTLPTMSRPVPSFGLICRRWIGMRSRQAHDPGRNRPTGTPCLGASVRRSDRSARASAGAASGMTPGSLQRSASLSPRAGRGVGVRGHGHTPMARAVRAADRRV